jgi:integrative and conjugative element protein (TIGR02256 family)
MSDIDFSILRSERARSLAAYVLESVDATFAHISSVSTTESFDLVDLVLEPQLPQDRVIPILGREPVRLFFSVSDDAAPSVLSLRGDFPTGLVHTTRYSFLKETFLCVWEEKWNELRRSLTAQALVERLRNWFTRTASGELHQEGQPLEPLIPATSHTLIIPAGRFPSNWHVADVSQSDGIYTVIVREGGIAADSVPLRFPIFFVELPPQVHGALNSRPYDLQELRQLVEPMDESFFVGFADWLLLEAQLKAPDKHALIVVSLPKMREAGCEPEQTEIWAFSTNETIGTIGELLGCTYDEGSRARRRVPRGPVGETNKVTLFGWRVVQRLDRNAARRLAGNASQHDRRLVAVGAGALGSNVLINMVHSGIGTWTVIDDDLVLPHNTVRQAQGDWAVGLPKADSAKAMADDVMPDTVVSICGNVLKRDEAINAAFSEADLILDFSASPAALGNIADDILVKRAASVFFNPDGTDLVILAEDAERKLKLDEIEAQYFFAVATARVLDGHLASARLDLVRYANACQDLSRPLPPWQVQTLCGIAAGKLAALTETDSSLASIWRLNPATGDIRFLSLKILDVHRHVFSSWRITVSQAVLANMQELRRRSLPNETGGVLIGTFDAARRVVHIVAALTAPPDSRQTPTYFIRGAKDLKPYVDGLSARSAGSLSYLGEWHSHPDAAPAKPSGDDEKVFQYLRDNIRPSGFPYVMAICGSNETWLRAGWSGNSDGEGTMGHSTRASAGVKPGNV